MTTISVEDVAREALRLGEASPDKRYQKFPGTNCAYIHPDENGEYAAPGCLFGEALLNLGVTAERLRKDNPYSLGGGGASGINSLLSDLRDEGIVSSEGIGTDRFFELGEAMTEAQERQDDGMPWVRAVYPLREILSE